MTSVASTQALDLGALITQLGGGLALFLFGMRLMTESLKTVAGPGMKNLLARLTANRFTGALAGAIITAVVQSSSVTTVLVVGFVSAGLLNLSQSIGVILGANVGTTITAQIIAFQVYKYGLLMIAIGFFMEVLARREYLRQWGVALMGLGLIFFGMELMSIGTEPLRQWPPFIAAMKGIENPLLSILIGAAFTAIVQSSSATTGIVIVLASQGLISLETGIGLVLGSNIGTCVTAFISAVGRPREAMQVAWVHIIFNVVGVMLWVLFIPQLAELSRSLSPSTVTLPGTAASTADLARQIANAHSIFNLTNLVLFIWFTTPLARLVNRIVPLESKPELLKPSHLDDLYLEQPAIAFDMVRRELVQMGGLTSAMLGRSLHAMTLADEEEIHRVAEEDKNVDLFYQETVRFLGKLTQKNLVLTQPMQLSHSVGIANYIEGVGDVIKKDMLVNAEKRSRTGMVISPATIEKLTALDTEVRRSYELALSALETGSVDDALKVIERKSIISDLAQEAKTYLATRLVDLGPGRVDKFQTESEMVESYQRIDTLSRRIARLCLKLYPDHEELNE